MLTSLLFDWHYRRFLAACRSPWQAQASRLRAILRQAADSAVGRDYGFAELARLREPSAMVREYQRRVPIRSYHAMRADLDAVYAGEWRRLCPSQPIFFAMTAGSSGDFKYIPVTRESRREVGRASQVFYGAMQARWPALRQLKCQFLVGSAEGGYSPGGIPQGFASGFNYKNLPRALRHRFALPYWIFALPDADDRAYAAGRMLVSEQRLGALGAISPVNLINVKRALEQNVERLCADIAAGTLTLRKDATGAGRYHGDPDPKRARTLQLVWQRTGTLPARLLFPSLQALVCWRGGNMGYHIHELEACFEHRHHLEFPLSASEAVFAIPCDPVQAGGIVAVTTHFLEFVPEDSACDGTVTAFTADQLQLGVTYRIVVTTAAGLYRYDMEDLVRVTGFHEATPMIEFISKASRQVSVSNERLTEHDVTMAMLAASHARGQWVDDFLFVPCSDRRYRVVVEGTDGIAACRGDFAAELDRQLRMVSKGYDFERDDALLQPLEMVAVARGALASHAALRQARSPLPNAQIKPCHLTTQFDAHTGFREVGDHATLRA